MIFTGDLTHDSEDPAEHAKRMKTFRDISGRLRAKKRYHVPGEHDAALDGGTLFRENFGETHYSFDHRGVHFVALDNVSLGKPAIGAAQLAWLKRELRASNATWKIIAADLPIGLIVPDGTAQEGIAQGDAAGPLGREREIADLLSYIKHRRITGTVWLTADVHYTAAHHYDPSRASFTDFDPFWEFVSGPVNAGAFGPNVLDPTFGPEAVFVKAPPRANMSPLEGFQHFGEVEILGESGELTVRLRDQGAGVLFSKTLAPQPR